MAPVAVMCNSTTVSVGDLSESSVALITHLSIRSQLMWDSNAGMVRLSAHGQDCSIAQGTSGVTVLQHVMHGINNTESISAIVVIKIQDLSTPRKENKGIHR